MEAIMCANSRTMSGCVGCLANSSFVLPAKPLTQRCDCSLGVNSLGGRSVLGFGRGGIEGWLSSATSFKDQSHTLFYGANPCASGRRLSTSVSGMKSASGGVMENDAKLRKKMEKKEMKMRKEAMKKQERLESSESSESSESESEDMKKDRSSARQKKSSAELRAEWAAISSSPVMDTIPRMSFDYGFVQQSERRSYAFPRDGVIEAETVKSDLVRTPSPLRAADVTVLRDDEVQKARDLLLRRHSGLQASVATGVEVCMNSTCRKNGAQDVLSAFQANAVNAIGCSKCMKNCKNAVSVRVGLDGGETEMHSKVGPEDVSALSQKYFGDRRAAATDRYPFESVSGSREGGRMARH